MKARKNRVCPTPVQILKSKEECLHKFSISLSLYCRGALFYISRVRYFVQPSELVTCHQWYRAFPVTTAFIRLSRTQKIDVCTKTQEKFGKSLQDQRWQIVFAAVISTTLATPPFNSATPAFLPLSSRACIPKYDHHKYWERMATVLDVQFFGLQKGRIGSASHM